MRGLFDDAKLQLFFEICKSKFWKNVGVLQRRGISAF